MASVPFGAIFAVSLALILTACTSSPRGTGESSGSKSTAASTSASASGKAAPEANGEHPSAEEMAEAQLPEVKEQPAVLPPGYFDWPVYQARMSRGYFSKPKRRRGRAHWGIDLAAPKGTPILASHDGTVIYVGREFRGFGRLIMIEGIYGYATLYAHLSRSRVRMGQKVKQGQIIGDMGNTGRSTGVHLHFEIRRRTGPVDPLLYLPAVDPRLRSQSAN